MQKSLLSTTLATSMVGSLIALLCFTPAAQAFGQANVPGVPVSRSDFGVNTFTWDSQITTVGATSALESLGVGMQQFPNSVNWNWQTNMAVANPQNPVNPSSSPESLNAWGKLLTATGQTGLYIYNYDQAPGWTGGGTAQDATQLANYILQHHIPVSAIVIGSEEYGQWDFAHNLHKNKSALAYAKNAAVIAQAIHTVLPAVKIGVSFEDGLSAHALEWDQDVLRLDAPYINFLSVHAYPFSSSVSPSTLLQGLPSAVEKLMATADQQIAANVPPAVASRITVWVTEWNPESTPGSLSLTSTYGAAMVESLVALRAAGAHKVFVWSFDGGADAPGNNGTFGLVANGALGSLAMNQLYPSGQAVASFMQAVGSGSSLTAWTGANGFAAEVQGSVGKAFFINTTGSTQSYVYNGSNTVVVPSDSMVEVSASVQSVVGMTAYQKPSIPSNGIPLSLPALIHVPQSLYAGETVTIQGAGFGKRKGYIHLSQGPLVWGTSTSATVSWGLPGNFNAVDTLSWSPSKITFVVPNNTSAPNGHFYSALSAGRSATLSVVTADQTISSAANVQVSSAPPVTLEQVSASNLYPGEWVTLKGVNFGSNKNGSYLHIADNGVNWGAPGNWYHINFSSWTNDRIRFQVPNGMNGSGEPLPSGTATLQVVNATGASSQPQSITVSANGAIISTISPTTITPGESVSVAGTGFGSSAGYVQLMQGGTSWGAPGNVYGVKITGWSATQVTFLVPDGKNAPGVGVLSGPATIRIVSSQGVSTASVQVNVG